MVAGHKEVRGKLDSSARWRVLFWGWQMLMVFWLFEYVHDVAPLIEAHT